MKQRKQMIQEKRDLLKQLPKQELVDRICNYPDQRSLNMDADGKWRDHPIGNMAHRIRDDQHYQMTDKQYYSLIHHYAALTIPELRVVGVTHQDVDAMELDWKPVDRAGSKSVYEMQFHLRPEPDNKYDANAVAVYATTTLGEERQLGYVGRKFLEQHPIAQEMDVTGTMIDFSNGHFNNVSYRFPLDTEQLETDRLQGQAISFVWEPLDGYVYEKPIALSEDCQITNRVQMQQWLQEQDRQFDDSSFLTTMVKNELEFWKVDGKGTIQQVSYQFPTTREGVVQIVSQTPMSADALAVVDSYINHIQDGVMASSMQECPYVQIPLSADVFAQTNGRFRLAAEPALEQDSVADSSLEQGEPDSVTDSISDTYEQMTIDSYLTSMTEPAPDIGTSNSPLDDSDLALTDADLTPLSDAAALLR